MAEQNNCRVGWGCCFFTFFFILGCVSIWGAREYYAPGAGHLDSGYCYVLSYILQNNPKSSTQWRALFQVDFSGAEEFSSVAAVGDLQVWSNDKQLAMAEAMLYPAGASYKCVKGKETVPFGEDMLGNSNLIYVGIEKKTLKNTYNSMIAFGSIAVILFGILMCVCFGLIIAACLH